MRPFLRCTLALVVLGAAGCGGADTAHVAAVVLQQGEQAAVAGAEVEDARGFASDLLEQHALSLGAARMLLCPASVAIDVRGGLPFRHESEYAPTAPG